MVKLNSETDYRYTVKHKLRIRTEEDERKKCLKWVVQSITFANTFHAITSETEETLILPFTDHPECL